MTGFYDNVFYNNNGKWDKLHKGLDIKALVKLKMYTIKIDDKKYTDIFTIKRTVLGDDIITICKKFEEAYNKILVWEILNT